MKRSGALEAVCGYPVKNMAGEETGAAFVCFSGLLGDRVYAFETEQGLREFSWLTGREQGDLITYSP